MDFSSLSVATPRELPTAHANYSKFLMTGERGEHGIAVALTQCLLPALLAAISLTVAVAIRGAGWDGDSVVNIAQFEKLIHPQLFDTPDGGTVPKLLPIVLFGGFHWLTGSYSIHWLSIALTAIAIGQLISLPSDRGGGWIWLALPFLSPTWIGAVLDADNPALQTAFLIIGFASLMKHKPDQATIFFLLAEFSRPGPCLLIAFLIAASRLPAFAKAYGNLNLPLACLALVMALAHAAFSYRLAYANLSDFIAQNLPPGEPTLDSVWKEYPQLLPRVSKLAFQSLPAPLPIFLLGLSVVGWGLCVRAKRLWNNAAWAAFFVPLWILPAGAVLTGTLSLEARYLLPAVLPLMAGIALLFYELSFVLPSPRLALIVWGALALGLAVKDGLALKGSFEVNPPESTEFQQWSSDPRLVSLVRSARDRSERPLVVLTDCDLIPLIVEISGFVSKFVIFSETSAANNTNRYLRDCTGLLFKKREVDVLLSEYPNPVATVMPDIIYTTANELTKLDGIREFDAYFLRAERVLLVRKSVKG